VSYAIPFNRPFLAGNELRYVAEAVARGHISGNGHFTRLCEDLLAQLIAVPRVMLTTSCTDALEMAALLLDLQPCDEIILPSFTFVSTANAFVLRGCRPIFVDIRPDTLNLDEERIEARISPRTRAIVPVHYGGVSCEMDVISRIAGERGLRVIEDNAHGLFGRYKGRPLGSLGDLAAHSFHETKNCSCGEGGALAIRESALVERAEVLREKGTNRARFFRGDVDKYTWVDLGSSFLPSDLLAAFLFAQLERRESIQKKRGEIWSAYAAELADWAGENEVRLPGSQVDCESSFHLFYLILPSEAARDGLIGHLRSEGILAVSHYQPLHLSSMGRRFGYEQGDLPVTEDISRRLIRLPFYNDLSRSDQDRVIGEVRRFRPIR
jgi:dTDP-4-amino-4,6-dideoxygalactose transaminase